MEAPRLELATTELDFLHRLLLDLQRRLAAGRDICAEDEQSVAALDLELGMLQCDGSTPRELDAQVGLGAAVQMKLCLDAMCAYQQWRSERRRQLAGLSP